MGFISGNRTSDAHLILHNQIRNYCHKKGKYLYSCFADSIPRDLLLQKLLSKGIKGKLFNLLKNIYSHEICKIKIGNHLSKPISVNQGVRQGCIISPILFNIFISDLPTLLGKPENLPSNISDLETLGCILWADDLVLLSEEEIGLRKMIQELDTYATNNGLKINEEKSKCMIFNKTGRLIRKTCGNLTINSVREYKYLGFVITPSGEVLTGLKDLKSRGAYALLQLRKKLGPNFRKYPKITLYLFDSLVKPVLMYMSDFWGFLIKQRNGSTIELIHYRFLKQLLGVQQQTSNTGVLLEMGRFPLAIFAKRNCVKNWERIARENCNKLLTLSYTKYGRKRNHMV